MARQIDLLVSSALVFIAVNCGRVHGAPVASDTPVVSSTAAAAAGTPSPSATPSTTLLPPNGRAPFVKDEHLEQAAFLDGLTPARRQKFKQDLERWKKLSPEKQAELRKNEQARIKQMLKDVNEAIEENGLKLNSEQRQLFTYKFAQERRTIEETLRKEMDEKRSQAVEKLISDLVAEFGTMPPYSGYSTPSSPAATATPKP